MPTQSPFLLGIKITPLPSSQSATPLNDQQRSEKVYIFKYVKESECALLTVTA